MNWNNITLRQFNQLQEDLKIEDSTERLVAVASTVYDEDISALSLPEFNEKIRSLKFLNEEIPNDIRLPKNIKANDHEYEIRGLLGELTAAQYIDYNAYLKEGDMKKLASVFIIPTGHKYNDGYDLEDVLKDIDSIPITLIYSLAFFFERQLRTFTRIFQYSLRSSLKKNKATRPYSQLLSHLWINSTSYPTS